MQTYEILNAMVPTRLEKRRIAEARGYRSESAIYQDCEDPERPGGRRNCFDEVLLYVDHALVHHPDAALAAAQFLTGYVEGSLAAAAGALPVDQVILRHQPSAEMEGLEAVRALSTALRQMVLGGAADTPALLREIEEAAREFNRLVVMLRAAVEADSQPS
jgi:hypothetical protein